MSSHPSLLSIKYGNKSGSCVNREINALKSCINDRFRQPGDLIQRYEDFLDVLFSNRDFFLINHMMNHEETRESDYFSHNYDFYIDYQFQFVNYYMNRVFSNSSILFYRSKDRQLFEVGNEIKYDLISRFINENATVSYYTAFSTELINDLFQDGKRILVQFNITLNEISNQDYLVLDSIKEYGYPIYYFGIDQSSIFRNIINHPDNVEYPIISVLGIEKKTNTKWLKPQSISSNEWLNQFRQGGVSPYILSEETPEHKDQIQHIVGNTFNDYVIKSSKPVLVIFYQFESYSVETLFFKMNEIVSIFGESLSYGYINTEKNEIPIDLPDELPLIGLFVRNEVYYYLIDWIRYHLSDNKEL